jgi:surfactin synthase thioesterase subunit
VSVSLDPEAPPAVCFEPRRSAAVRLLCLPHAGAGASVFRAWGRELPGWVELQAILLPGREGRLADPLPGDLTRLADELVPALAPVTREPYALYGHSMGALLAYELARRLEAGGERPPLHLFVAGYGAPHVYRSHTRLHVMEHDEVVEELRRTRTAPEPVLNEPGLMRIFVPILQKDLRLCVEHVSERTESEPLATGISAFGGSEDTEVPAGAVAAWADLTTGPFRLRMLPGGHFFPASARAALIDAIGRDLPAPRVAA